MAVSRYLLKTLAGVDRPAIASVLRCSATIDPVSLLAIRKVAVAMNAANADVVPTDPITGKPMNL